MTIHRSVLLAIAALAGGAGAAIADTGDLYMMTGAGNGTSSLWRLNKTTASAFMIGSTGLDHFTGIDFDPKTGTLYAHRNNGGAGELYTIDPTTAAATFVGGTAIQSPDMTFDNSGNLLAWSEFGTGTYVTNSMVGLDKASGAITELGPSGVSPTRAGLFTALDGTLYLKNYDAGLWSVDPGTGAASFHGQITGVAGGDTNSPTDVDPTSGLMYMIDRRGGSGAESRLYSVDLGTLTATEVGVIYDNLSGSFVTDISGLGFDTVPAPGSLALLGIGAVSVARRRRV